MDDLTTALLASLASDTFQDSCSPCAASCSGVASGALSLLKNPQSPCFTSTSTLDLFVGSRTGCGKGSFETDTGSRNPVLRRAETPRFGLRSRGYSLGVDVENFAALTVDGVLRAKEGARKSGTVLAIRHIVEGSARRGVDCVILCLLMSVSLSVSLQPNFRYPAYVIMDPVGMLSSSKHRRVNGSVQSHRE